MRFNKNYKRGIILLFLLLLLTTSISFITFDLKNNKINQNSVFLSAPEDNYEPNNDPILATDIRFNEANWLGVINGNGTLWDDDWYLIDIDLGEERLKVDLIFNHAAGNIDIEVYNDAYFFIIGNYSMDDNEFLELDLFPSGIYYLRIFGANAGNTYDFYWEDLIPHDDPFEENDDIGSSARVDPNYYSGLRIVDYDEDWFGLSLTSGDIINVFIYFNHMQGDLNLELYDPSNSNRIGSYSINNEESFSFPIDVSGDWRIRVYRVSGSGDVDYDLDMWLDMVGPGDDDSFEENDGFWSSAWIDPNWYPDLRILGDDEDWFHLYLNTGDVIDVTIHFYHEEGDLQLELYDPSETQREGSYSSTENYDWSKEHIIYRADMAGDWRIRVYHEDGDSDVHYDMDIRIKDDWYEFNNDFHEAYDLHDDEYTWLSDIHGLAVQGDEDWYMIHVTPGFQHLIVNLMFEGNINVDLYNLSDTHTIEWRYGNHSMLGDHRIDINYTSTFGIKTGIYFIKVTGDYSGLEYDLWWDDIRTDTRDDDNYEENDDPLSAYDLSSHKDEDLWRINGSAIQRDNDWYKIKVDTGFEHLFVEVKYDYQEGAIGIAIYDWNFNEVTSNFTERDMEFINYDLPSNGTYYIRIFGDSSGNIYSLRWETWEPYQEEMIPGYDIFILLSAIFGVATVIILKWKRSKRNL